MTDPNTPSNSSGNTHSTAELDRGLRDLARFNNERGWTNGLYALEAADRLQQHDRLREALEKWLEGESFDPSASPETDASEEFLRGWYAGYAAAVRLTTERQSGNE